MTMQALAIIERGIELDVFRLWYFPQVLDVNVMQSPPLGCYSAKHRVIRVAGITGVIAGYTIILKVHRRYIAPVIHVETRAIILHNVTGKAELSTRRAFHLI